jgi:FixJ family two-component response regulator
MAKPPRRIVVVDNDADMRRAIERLLAAAGFDVRTFARADELLEGDSAAAADCVILDIHMPGPSGLGVAERPRASGVRTPVIFITAYDDPVTRARAARAGASGYLPKPFVRESLLAALAAAMG